MFKTPAGVLTYGDSCVNKTANHAHLNLTGKNECTHDYNYVFNNGVWRCRDRMGGLPVG